MPSAKSPLQQRAAALREAVADDPVVAPLERAIGELEELMLPRGGGGMSSPRSQLSALASVTERLASHLPPPGPKTFIFMCGPPPMINFACKPNLEKVGHTASNMHCF